MAMGRHKPQQADLMMSWVDMPRSPGHAFYDMLQTVLVEGDFDDFAEEACRPFYAQKMGAPSVPPGRYFRMHLIGYFEGIDSERGIAWRVADSLSLRQFLQVGLDEPTPDHVTISRTRRLIDEATHGEVFGWVLRQLARARLLKGRTMGIDATTKWPEEGLLRPMPDPIEMDDEVLKKVAKNWRAYGFGS